LQKQRKARSSIPISGFAREVIHNQSQANCYVKVGFTSDAHHVFDDMTVKTTFSWNTIVSAYAKNRAGYSENAIQMVIVKLSFLEYIGY